MAKMKTNWVEKQSNVNQITRTIVRVNSVNQDNAMDESWYQRTNIRVGAAFFSFSFEVHQWQDHFSLINTSTLRQPSTTFVHFFCITLQ
jgi:hypothetical protein